MNNETINLKEAAKFLGFKSGASLCVKVKRGEIPGFKAGKSWMFYVPDLVDYIRSKYDEARKIAQVDIQEKILCQSAKEKVALIIKPHFRSVESEYANLRERLLNQKRNDTKKSAGKR